MVMLGRTNEHAFMWMYPATGQRYVEVQTRITAMEQSGCQSLPRPRGKHAGARYPSAHFHPRLLESCDPTCAPLKALMEKSFVDFTLFWRQLVRLFSCFGHRVTFWFSLLRMLFRRSCVAWDIGHARQAVIPDTLLDGEASATEEDLFACIGTAFYPREPKVCWSEGMSDKCVHML